MSWLVAVSTACNFLMVTCAFSIGITVISVMVRKKPIRFMLYVLLFTVLFFAIYLVQVPYRNGN